MDKMIEYRGHWFGARNRSMGHQVILCLSLCAKALPQEVICRKVMIKRLLMSLYSNSVKQQHDTLLSACLSLIDVRYGLGLNVRIVVKIIDVFV